MPNIIDTFINALSGDQIKDYKHASRLFVDNNYERAPKYTTLFHVFFDLNTEFTQVNQREQIAAGMLVKSIELPKFRVETKTFNNYNRPSIVQSKVRYEDVNITFHDDNANIVRKLWWDYFNFYYRDMDNNYGDSTGSLNPIYLKNTKQTLGQRQLLNKFGYTPRSTSNVTSQYIRAIRIYSLHQKRFSEYTLINPTITSYRHGTHSNGQDGPMENTMTISYETVLYAGGFATYARGFADLYYDKSPSPLSVLGGGTNSFLGPGGIVNAFSEVISQGSNKNFGAAALIGATAFSRNKNADLGGMIRAEGLQAFDNILINGNLGSGLNQTYVPYRGVNTTNGAGFQSALATSTSIAPGSVISNGRSIGAGSGVVGTSNTFRALAPVITAGLLLPGVTTNSRGQITGGAANNVVNLQKDQNNNLVATSSNPLPSDSNTQLLQTANDNIRNVATANNYKNLQESNSVNTAFLAQNVQNVNTVFQSGTNNIVQGSSNILATTPYRNQQIITGSETASTIGLLNLGTPGNSNYSPTTTNPRPA